VAKKRIKRISSRMKFKSTFIFGFIFLALAAYVYFFEIKGGERQKEAERESKEVLSFEKGHVAELALTYPDRKIQCVRDTSDIWWLVEPIETEGSTDDITAILTSLEEATVRRTLADSVEHLSEYGLDEPQVTVSIRQEGEHKWHSLMLGATNPTGAYAYAKRGETPAVFLVSSTLVNSLTKKVHDLRFKKVLDFDTQKISKISLDRGGGPIVCSKALDDWMLEKPIQARADGQKIDEIVRTLHEAEVEEFVAEECDDAAVYGLDRPTLRVSLAAGETEVTKSLNVGKKKGKTYYAKDVSRDPVFTLDSSLVSELEVNVFDVRDKSVLAFKPHKVREIRLRTGNLDLRCRKDTTGTWQILEPIHVRADESKINDLLWGAEGLKAEEFVSDSPKDFAPYGLAEPKVQIELWMDSDSTARILSIGKKEGERVYVRNNTAPSIYLVPSEFPEKIGKDVSDFRAAHILNFYAYQVREIEIVHGGETSFWKKDSEGDWKGSSERSVKKSQISELLSELESLNVEEFVEDDPSDLAQYGLAEPRYTVRLHFEEKPSQVLFVGTEENGKVYVKSGETDSIFLTTSNIVVTLKPLLPEENEGT
jgi:hypothetical protein